MSALDFLRDVGKHFRVNQMVKKEAIAARLNSDEGISYTEFSYQLLQGLDYLQLYRDFGCTLQTGGNDQWGNLTAGSDLIHRVEGASVHLLTTPLLTDSSGEKFGKSAGNAIWLSPEMTSPYAFYQYWLNVEDASVRHPAARSSPTARARSSPSSSARWRRSRSGARRSGPWPPTSRPWCTGPAATAAVQAAVGGAVRQGRPARPGRRAPCATPRPSCPGERSRVGMSRRRRARGGGPGRVAQRRPPGDRRGRGLGQRREGRPTSSA